MPRTLHIQGTQHFGLAHGRSAKVGMIKPAVELRHRLRHPLRHDFREAGRMGRGCRYSPNDPWYYLIYLTIA
jgi:hypothetical protein